jgi:hypothetical protein
MNDPEDFVSRWSRRKREALRETEAANAPAEEDRACGDVAPRHAPAPAELAFDPACLPAIESITAETDIRGFLAPGVPSELTRAALRRAWTCDPKIKNFVGLADYDWDFNAAGSMAGFGPLPMIDEVGKIAARIMDPARAEPGTCNLADSASTTSEGEEIAGEAGSDTEHRGAAEMHDQQKRRDEPVNEIGTLPHLDGSTRPEHGLIAAQYSAANPDERKAFVKHQHGGALPK